jgi:hypothetical protein
MRAILIVCLLVFLSPAIANAQGAPATTGSPGSPPNAGPAATSRAEPRARGGRDISRDEYIERAKHNAEKRFERMDANHDGILTIEERRAARGKRRQKSEPE